WFVAGAMAGSAGACKYTALVSTAFPCGIVAVASCAGRFLKRGLHAELTPANSPAHSTSRPGRQFGLLLAVVLGAGIACGPWFAKNWVMTGNPVYPLLYRLFDGRNWTPEKNGKWEWGHRVSLLVALGAQRPPEGIATHPLDPQHALTWRRLAENIVDVTARS